MSLIGAFRPKATLSDDEVARGLRMMTWEGTVSIGFWSITTSGFLAAFALALGANNLQIGVLAAIPFITQNFQLPSILLVERLKWRKAISVISWFMAQAIWFPIALIPWFIDVPHQTAALLLLGLMAIRGVLAAICNAAWNGWVRDLIPPHMLGRFFSRRLAYGTVAAIGFSLGTSFFVEHWHNNTAPNEEVYGFTIALLAGALLLGMAGPVFMSFMPEPMIQPPTTPQPSLAGSLFSPFRDRNFQQLLKFLFLWGAASNLAIPFFAVHMLTQLDMSLPQVIGLGVVSQLFNILFLKVWGGLFDRFGSKVILSLSSSLYLVVIVGWIFTTMPDRYFLTIPLLVLLHIFAGIAAAGLNLSVATIGLKLAPKGEATSYLAAASVASNVGSGIGPLLGGLFVDFFSVRGLSLKFTWFDPQRNFEFPALDVTGFDFLFAIAFVMGLFTLRLLTSLQEEGEVHGEIVLEELQNQTRENFRAVSTVPGLGFVNHFPYSYLRRVPGVNVVMGVTAYQVASSIRSAVTATTHGGEVVADVAERISETLGEMMEGVEEFGEQSVELARHAARGAMNAIDEVAQDVGELAKGVVWGVLGAMRKSPTDEWDWGWDDVVNATAYGTVQGAGEAGADIVEAAVQAVEAAREAAQEYGLPEEAVTAQATQGALAAVEAAGNEETMSQVRSALALEDLTVKVGEGEPERTLDSPNG